MISHQGRALLFRDPVLMSDGPMRPVTWNVFLWLTEILSVSIFRKRSIPKYGHIMETAFTARPRGRPRAFHEDRFLDASIALFSSVGFAGVSMSDLTKTSGLTTGSIYKAYKDKEGVFACALKRYIALREVEIDARLSYFPDARGKIAALLRLFAALSQGRDGRLGCMVVSGVADLTSWAMRQRSCAISWPRD